MAEFLIALIPFLLAFLGFTQLCFIGIAKLMVRHSAALAARAAVVVLEEADGLPGAPVNIYEGFPAGGLEVAKPPDSGGAKSKGSTDKAQAGVSNLSETASNSDSTRRTMEGLLGSLDRTSSRIKQIRTAAYWPLLAVSPNLLADGVDLASGVSDGSVFPKLKVSTAIGSSDSARILGAFMYNLGAVAVTFPEDLGSKTPTDGMFKAGAMVTTRVSYLFRCMVPFVSPLICSSGWALMFGDAWMDPFAIQKLANTVGSPPKRAQDMPEWVDGWKKAKEFHEKEQKRVDAFKGRELEFNQVEWPFMTDVLLAWPGARYYVLSAEAQLPLQSANYYPRAIDADMDNMWKLQQKREKNSGDLPDVRGTLAPVASGLSSGARAVEGGLDKVSDAISQLPIQEGAAAVNSVNNATNQLGSTTQGLGGTTNGLGGATKNLAGGLSSGLSGGVTNALSGGLTNGLGNVTQDLAGATNGMNGSGMPSANGTGANGTNANGTGMPGAGANPIDAAKGAAKNGGKAAKNAGKSAAKNAGKSAGKSATQAGQSLVKDGLGGLNANEF